MPRTPASDTAARIKAVALELFATQGFEKTSLQQIADRLGLTKPALYYHFPSKEALIRSLVQPLMEDLQALLDKAEAVDATPPRQLLEAVFDLTYRHRSVLIPLAHELSALGELTLEGEILDWRRRVQHLLAPPGAPLAAQARAVLAIGGLQDCVVMLSDVPVEQLRPAVVDAACAALGLPAPSG